MCLFVYSCLCTHSNTFIYGHGEKEIYHPRQMDTICIYMFIKIAYTYHPWPVSKSIKEYIYIYIDA
jgi:hypothetical protein